MNFNIGSSSQHLSYFSSSSNSNSEKDDDIILINDIEVINAHEEAIMSMIANNNICMVHYLNQLNNKVIHGGSVTGHITINRDREVTDRNLFNDYFSDNLCFNDLMDGVNRLGLSGLQKIIVVFWMLAYGMPTDATDESPNANNVARLLHVGKERGFPGMLDSLDCKHWKWKNCPTAWAGQYAGRNGTPTIILEAVADYDIWIWHVHFSLPGSNNDINMSETSHLFANLASSITHLAHYVIKGNKYNMSYYLANGIYSK
ncbi:hypothetical protein AB3S75_011859 [Citrus x aurantiifolia]